MTFTKADIIDIGYGPEYAIKYHGVRIQFEQVRYFMERMDYSHYNVVTSGRFICEIQDTWPIAKIRAEITAALVQCGYIVPRRTRAHRGDKSPSDVSEHPHE